MTPYADAHKRRPKRAFSVPPHRLWPQQAARLATRNRLIHEIFQFILTIFYANVMNSAAYF